MGHPEHRHSHPHAHAHPHEHSHSHAHSHEHPSRRDFFRTVMGGAMAGLSIMELAQYRAAWAQALTPGAGTDLFNIEKVTEDVYFAISKPTMLLNCNAAIFVNSRDVVVVDAHSKPSAAASLIAQIKKDITPKPVRYLVDTHFHWDHAQGNAAYRAAGAKVVASKATRDLMAQNSGQRLHTSLDPAGHTFPGQPHIPAMLDAARERLAKAPAADKARMEDQVRQVEAFAAEMKNFSPVLPSITFDKKYVIKDKAHDIHVEFHGRAHTAGDVAIYCPQRRVVATGDMILGFTPFIADGYPKDWPKTIDSVSKLEFDYILPGHGRVQQGRQRMNNLRDYIEEVTQRVEAGKKAGQSVADLQKNITAASLKSLQADGYVEFLLGPGAPNAMATMQTRVNTNIQHIYDRLDKS
jgi:glyoxylase-like metal-dependent hydrolase (beta-lactamase superfamily II)